MRPVDRFLAFMRFQAVDRPPLLEEGAWKLARERWRAEGMGDVSAPPYLAECDAWDRTATDLWMLPRYETRVLAEDETSLTYMTDRGVVMRRLKPLAEGMPLHLRYPVESRADWNVLKPRFLPNCGERLGADWPDKCAQWRQQGVTVRFQGQRAPSLFGFVRELMGPERALTMFYDDPWLVHDMMETSMELSLAMLQRVLDDFAVSALFFWEDMAYRAGSLISPAMFRRFMMPRYKRITAYARSRGVEIIMVDSDGNIEELIPLWLESGLDGVYPLEVAAGMDVVALRRRYGRDLLMKGGIDKRVLARSKTDIDDELERKLPVAESGGYIPTIDHTIPHDVPYANLLYYWERKKQMLGVAA